MGLLLVKVATMYLIILLKLSEITRVRMPDLTSMLSKRYVYVYAQGIHACRGQERALGSSVLVLELTGTCQIRVPESKLMSL